MVAMRDGDWICPRCENHNFASRQSCNKCAVPRGPEAAGFSSYGAQRQPAQPRPSPYSAPAMVPYSAPRPMQSGGGDMKDGDWMCPGCGNHNFASRVNCNRCQELREGMKQGDWICRNCKNHNFANKTACNKCAAPRPAESAGPAPGARRAHSAPPAAAYGGCGGYGGGCGYGGGYGGCGGKGGMMYGGCGGGYGGVYGGYGGPCMGGPVYGYMGGGKGMAPMMASPMVPYGMMSAPMPSGKPMKDGDWMCPSCGNHNFASRVNCNKCKLVRQGFKEGDWICRECKNHNFKSRTECNKCQKPKS